MTNDQLSLNASQEGPSIDHLTNRAITLSSSNEIANFGDAVLTIKSSSSSVHPSSSMPVSDLFSYPGDCVRIGASRAWS